MTDSVFYAPKDLLATARGVQEYHRGVQQCIDDHTVGMDTLTGKWYADKPLVSPGSNPDSHEPLGIVLTVTTHRRYALFERLVQSLVTYCEDIDRVREWWIVDDGSSVEDLQRMHTLMQSTAAVRKYTLFTPPRVNEVETNSHAASMVFIQRRIVNNPDIEYVLHLEDDWEFFLPRPFIGDCVHILEHDAQLGQVCLNQSYMEVPGEYGRLVGTQLRHTGRMPYYVHMYTVDRTGQQAVLAQGEQDYALCHHRLPSPVSSVHWPHYSLRPSLVRRSVFTGPLYPTNRVVNVNHSFELQFATDYFVRGFRTAFLPGLYAVHTGRKCSGLLRQLRSTNDESLY